MEGYQIDHNGNKMVEINLDQVPQQLGRTQSIGILESSDSRSFRKKPPKPTPLPISPKIKANLPKRKKNAPRTS